MTFEDIYKQVLPLIWEKFMPRTDCEVLHKYALKLEKANIVELGAFGGRSGLTLALSSPSSMVYSVDNLTETMTVDYPFPKGEPTQGLLNLIPKIHNWYLIVGDTRTSWQFWYKPIDLLFIDASHKYEDVVEDVKGWTPFLKKNGILLMHDANHIPDVIGAIKDYLTPDKYEKFPFYKDSMIGEFKKL